MAAALCQDHQVGLGLEEVNVRRLEDDGLIVDCQTAGVVVC